METSGEYSEDFLARWLAGELSASEQEAFEQSEAYVAYKDIINGADRLQKPDFDIAARFQQQKAYNAKQVIAKPTIMHRLYIGLSCAAAVTILIISVLFFNTKTTTLQTGIGQTSTWTLPDQSEVTLNAVSTVTYQEDDFLAHRTLQLEGEGVFKVAKGSTFTVQTANGSVKVLGTVFNVKDRKKQFEVHCYEGKVQVTKEDQVVVITAGQGVILDFTHELSIVKHTTVTPAWKMGKSVFKEVSLQELIIALCQHYPITIDAKAIDVNRRFTGFFVHNNLEHALLSCFEPMHIKYTFRNKTQVILTNK